MKKKTPQIQYGKSYRYRSTERAIKDLLKIEKRQKEEKAKKNPKAEASDDKRKL